jgi:hypothetical protein
MPTRSQWDSRRGLLCKPTPDQITLLALATKMCRNEATRSAMSVNSLSSKSLKPDTGKFFSVLAT